MRRIEKTKARKLIEESKIITFLTGAGISTPSGVPDYRSLSGIYHGIEQPEYLLSHSCLMKEPKKFYEFVKTLYHPEAKPNLIHQTMVNLSKSKSVWIVSQNIDGLHAKAGSNQLIDFHGSLYYCHCLKCEEKVKWTDYVQSDIHSICKGQIRPEITLYEETLSEKVIEQSIIAIRQSDLLVIVGTSFRVHPFCDLIHYAPEAMVLIINQTPIHIDRPYYYLEEDALKIFETIQ